MTAFFAAAWYTDTLIVGNEPWRIGALFAALLVSLVLGRIARFLLDRLAASLDRRSRKLAAVVCRSLAASAVLVFAAVGLAAGVGFLRMTPVVAGIAHSVTGALIAIAIGYVAWNLVDVIDHWLRSMAARTPSKLDDMLAPLVRKSLRGTVFVLALVQVLTIFSDKPITSVLAGLGVGGIAIGLAAQDTIKNFFGSLMICGDRPFELGDRIVVDTFDGTVESVGFRSTRIRTADGDLVTIPNGELANKPILNSGKRPSLRRAFQLVVRRDTRPEQLDEALTILKDILREHEGSSPNNPAQVQFVDFKDGGYILTVTYWYHAAGGSFAAFNERVNLEIVRRFHAAGIELASANETPVVVNSEGKVT